MRSDQSSDLMSSNSTKKTSPLKGWIKEAQG